MLLNVERVRQAAVRSSPYPYFVVTSALVADGAQEVARSFPLIDRPGTIPVEETSYGGAFGNLLGELRSAQFRQVVADKLNVDLEGRRAILNVRGLTRWIDGNIHTDTPSKLVTVLLYFNEPGIVVDTTGLRILRGPSDIEDFVEEVPPLLGTMVVFKVTPDCWHGHKPSTGERRSLQLSYLSGTKSRKHQPLRRLWGHATRRLHALASGQKAELVAAFARVRSPCCPLSTHCGSELLKPNSSLEPIVR